MTARPRLVEKRSIAQSRRFVTKALRAGRRIVPIHGLVQCDVTETRAYRQALDPPASLTAVLVAAVARAVAAHPEVHAYRTWAGKLAIHHHVDVVILIEASTADGSFPLAHLVRDADLRSPTDIGNEIRTVKADPSAGLSGKLFTAASPLVSRIPGAVSLFYRIAARSVRMRRLTGTAAVTSIGMLGEGGGFGIAFPTIQTLTVLVGGVSERPWLRDGEVVAREILDLTITVDHNIVDGAPVARFVSDLRRLVETPDLIE